MQVTCKNVLHFVCVWGKGNKELLNLKVHFVGNLNHFIS